MGAMPKRRVPARPGPRNVVAIGIADAQSPMCRWAHGPRDYPLPFHQFAWRSKYRDIEFSIDADPEIGLADSSDLDTDHADLLEALGRAAGERATALVLFIDELQHVPRGSAGGRRRRFTQHGLKIVPGPPQRWGSTSAR